MIACMLGMVTHLGFAIKAIRHYCIDVMIRYLQVTDMSGYDVGCKTLV